MPLGARLDDHRRVRIRTCAAVVWLALAPAAVVSAQPAAAPSAPPADPVAAAAALKAEGDLLMDNIRYGDALVKYEEAYKISANPALLYNMGRALEAMNRFPEALEKLRAFDVKATPELHAKVPNLKQLLDDVEGRTTLLTVEAPAGASIKLGDVVLGVAPLAELRVNAAKKARLEASLDGFDPDVQDVELPGKGRATVKMSLTPKDKSAILAIDSPVKGATVFVDGGTARQVPTEVRVLAGKHTVKLTAEGYRENLVDVEVAVGERRPLIIEPGEAPVYERWWFWTTIGLVAAGGAAAGVTAAVLIEAPPGEGTIPPKQVKVQAGEYGAPLRRGRWVGAGPRSRGPGLTLGPVPVLTIAF